MLIVQKVILNVNFKEIFLGQEKRFIRTDERVNTEERPIYVSHRGRHIITEPKHGISCIILVENQLR